MLALGAGVAAGIGVVLIDLLLSLLRQVAFGIPADGHLSDIDLGPARVLMMPVLGGLLVGLARRRCCGAGGRARSSTRSRRTRLFGGRMSVGDSLGLVAATLLSGGFGASVGLEAAYTQLGAALASRLGRSARTAPRRCPHPRRLRRRRRDRRRVQCAAHRRVLRLRADHRQPTPCRPWRRSASQRLTGALVVRGLVGSNPIFVVWHEITISAVRLPGLFRCRPRLGRARHPGHEGGDLDRSAVPLAGGAALGAAGARRRSDRRPWRWLFPQILGSGHGGIMRVLHSGFDLPFLAGLIVAKIVASAVSIGSGFRGGLFSTSLFLGSLFGSLIGALLARLGPGLGADPLVYALVGMGAVAAAIVGAPMTMIMIVLETTGDFSATIGVMVGVVTAAIAVRHWFGYSFATWRFHLRGLTIRSPEDVGWINELLVGPMMRRDPAVIAAELPVDELRRRFPAGSTRQVFVVDDRGGLCGVVDPGEASARERRRTRSKTVGDLVSKPAPFLLPGDNLRTALDRFSQAAQETLPVIDNPKDRRIIGYLSEAYALRRYAQELERHRGGRQDDAGIFSPASATRADRAASNHKIDEAISHGCGTMHATLPSRGRAGIRRASRRRMTSPTRRTVPASGDRRRATTQGTRRSASTGRRSGRCTRAWIGDCTQRR